MKFTEHIILSKPRCQHVGTSSNSFFVLILKNKILIKINEFEKI